MADSTIIVDIVDQSIPALNPQKIAIINKPNPVNGVTVTGRQLLKLIQFPQYRITESATGIVINGRNIFRYFPELDPEGGGSKKYTLISKAVYDNGIYKASDDNADGYRTMVVDVPSPVLVEKTITEDGVYNPTDDGADGYSLVTVHKPSTENNVTFYDYDGLVVATYTTDEFLALTSLPVNPTHEGLTSQGWNWTLADAKDCVETYGSLDIGQMYITDDGSTRLHIRLGDGRLKPYLGLKGDSNSAAVSIDWGDGSTAESVMLDTNTIYTPHEYATAGDYTISISIITGSITLTGTSNYSSNILRKSSSPTASNDRVYQNSLISIEIGNNATIGSSAFYYCSSLQTITIPDGVTSIGNGAFQYCYSLQSITIPDGVTSIGDNAFYSCYLLQSINIPDSVTSIGSSAFQYCYSLQSITIPDTVTSIGSQAFSDCRSLTSITIPDGVTSIGNYAFSDCRSLSSFAIPDGVTSIGDSAFYGCYALSSITIPDSVTSIGSNTFGNCSSLSSITIPDGVTSIGNGAFQYCYSLQSITIPDGVTSIGSNTFGNCSSLSSITIPDSVTSIGSNTFQYCYSLQSITIPDTVTSINGSVFYYCYPLSSITIPDSVTTISSNAFNSCYGLGSIKFTSTTPPTVANSNAWSNVPKDCIIYVPSGSLSAYKSATNYPSPSSYTYVEY